jgi:hypothetical protein
MYIRTNSNRSVIGITPSVAQSAFNKIWNDLVIGSKLSIDNL